MRGTTIGTYAKGRRGFDGEWKDASASDPSPLEGDGWVLVGQSAAEGCLFWTWVRDLAQSSGSMAERLEALAADPRLVGNPGGIREDIRAVAREAPGATQPAPRGRVQAAVYHHLAANPGAAYRDVATVLEGGSYSEGGYARARNIVRALRAGGWLSGGPGRWEILVPEVRS